MRLEEEVLVDLVRQFRVDDVNVALDPVGLYGRKLEVESLLVVMSISRGISRKPLSRPALR